MKKGLFYITFLIACVATFSGCIKSTVLTVVPSMTATVGTYTFNAGTIEPSVLKPQLNDSVNTLIITGYDPTINQKIVLSVRSYKELTGTFSIIMGQASATFYHTGITSQGTSGIVTITGISANSLTGYYSFSTVDGYSLTNGLFTVARPWDY